MGLKFGTRVSFVKGYARAKFDRNVNEFNSHSESLHIVVDCTLGPITPPLGGRWGSNLAGVFPLSRGMLVPNLIAIAQSWPMPSHRTQRQTSSNSSWYGLQYNDKQQGAKNWALMHPNLVLEKLVCTSFELHCGLWIIVHKLNHLYESIINTHLSQGPPFDLSRYSVKRLFKIHKGTPRWLYLET